MNSSELECPLWVKSGHPAIPSPMSAFGVIADIGCLLFESEAFLRVPMSAFGGRADLLATGSERPLIATSGHSEHWSARRHCRSVDCMKASDHRIAQTGRTRSCTRPSCITINSDLATPGPSTHSQLRTLKSDELHVPKPAFPVSRVVFWMTRRAALVLASSP